MSSWPPDVDRLLARCRFFTQARVWPIDSRIHPERWLGNFTADEIPFAAELLTSFKYYSPEMVDALLVSVFQSLGTAIFDPFDDVARFRTEWRDFIKTSVFTHVAGEHANASDSGHIFIRKLRQVIGIPEDRLFYHPEALEEAQRTGCRLVFVDDFVGSGQQFIHTWKHQPHGQTGNHSTFATSIDPERVLYCPLITTTKGLAEIASHASGDIRVIAAHVLGPEYGVTHPDSVVWSATTRPDAMDFLTAASDRAGIAPQERFGFASLGLTLGFDHSVPDATLRMFYWEGNGWNPLLIRR